MMLKMEYSFSFLTYSFFSVLCLSTQTNVVIGSEANVMSNKLVSHIDQVKNIGDPMNMYCNLDPQSTKDMMYCRWTQPNEKGEIVIKEDGKFIDTALPGIEIDKSNPNSCNITVQQTKDSDLGVWKCFVELNDSKQFQESWLTATTDGLVDDIRLPRHLIPEEYNVQLTPFIMKDNFTINGHVEILLSVANVLDAISNITLNIRNIDIMEDSVTVDGYDIIGHGYDEAREFYIVYLNKKAQIETQSMKQTEDHVAVLIVLYHI